MHPCFTTVLPQQLQYPVLNLPIPQKVVEVSNSFGMSFCVCHSIRFWLSASVSTISSRTRLFSPYWKYWIKANACHFQQYICVRAIPWIRRKCRKLKKKCKFALLKNIRIHKINSFKMFQFKEEKFYQTLGRFGWTHTIGSAFSTFNTQRFL